MPRTYRFEVQKNDIKAICDGDRQLDARHQGGRRGRVKEPDHRHHRMLRTRRERPRGRACKHRNKCASSHSITSSAGRRSWIESERCEAPPALQAERITRIDVAGACCATGIQPRLCGLGVRSRHHYKMRAKASAATARAATSPPPVDHSGYRRITAEQTL